jgi:hypothetical protein
MAGIAGSAEKVRRSPVAGALATVAGAYEDDLDALYFNAFGPPG